MPTISLNPGSTQVSSKVTAGSTVRYRAAFSLSIPRDAATDSVVLHEEAVTFFATAAAVTVDVKSNGSAIHMDSSSNQGTAAVFELERAYSLRQIEGSAAAYRVYRVDGATIADTPTLNASNKTGIGGFVAKRFALRRSGSEDALTVANISKLKVQSFPTGLRFGLATSSTPASDGSDVRFFWHAVGELTSIDQGSEPNAGAAQRFVKELKRYLADYLAENATGPIPLHLIAESDTPCAVTPRFNVEYSLSSTVLRDAADAPADKIVLRFAGRNLETQSLPLKLPAGATIQSLRLTIDASLRGGGTSLSHDSLGPAAVVKRGLALTDARWAVYALSLPEGQLADGLLIGLQALETNTEIRVEVFEDWSGPATGKRLASGVVALSVVGERGWHRLAFDQRLQLFAGQLWVTATVQRGRAVWLANDGTAQDARLFERSAGVPDRKLSRTSDLAPLVQLYAQSESTGRASSLRIAVGATTLELIAPDGSQPQRLETELAPLVQGQTAVAVSFSTTLAGFVTVSAPELRYSVA